MFRFLSLVALSLATITAVAQTTKMSPMHYLLFDDSAPSSSSKTRVFPAMTKIAPPLSDESNSGHWKQTQSLIQGIWVNASGASADETAGMLSQLELDRIPAILPGNCTVENDTVTCGSDAPVQRVNAANNRLAPIGKELIPQGTAFNTADTIGVVSVEKIIEALNTAMSQPALAGLRSGFLFHPRDGLNDKLPQAQQLIDAIDIGGVVAIEVSPNLLSANNRLEGCANLWKYAQSQGKQAVWLINGPRGEVSDWIANTESALVYWKSDHSLTLDTLAPIATLWDEGMPILPEGSGAWPPAGPTPYLSYVHSLFGLIRSL